VRYLWAAPATAVGLLVALPALLLGARARVVDGVLEVCGGRLAAALDRAQSTRRFCAITFGHVILGLGADVLERVRGHERAHVRQYERWGLLFFPLYAGASALAWLGGRNPYWHNRFERQARREARVGHPAAAGDDRDGEDAEDGGERGRTS
jgi:hypothetical protein